MSTHSIEDATAVAREPVTSVKGSAMCSTLIGLIPLGLLASCAALAVVLTVLARLLFANAGFFFHAATGSSDRVDCWIDPGNSRFCGGDLARLATGEGLAARRRNHTSERSPLGAWSQRLGDCGTNPAGTSVATASLSMILADLAVAASMAATARSCNEL